MACVGRCGFCDEIAARMAEAMLAEHDKTMSWKLAYADYFYKDTQRIGERR